MKNNRNNRQLIKIRLINSFRSAVYQNKHKDHAIFLKQWLNVIKQSLLKQRLADNRWVARTMSRQSYLKLPTINKLG